MRTALGLRTRQMQVWIPAQGKDHLKVLNQSELPLPNLEMMLRLRKTAKLGMVFEQFELESELLTSFELEQCTFHLSTIIFFST